MSCELSGDVGGDEIACNMDCTDNFSGDVGAEEIACDMDCTDNFSVSRSASWHNFGNTECAEDIAASTSDTRVLRMNIADPASAEEWMRQYKAATNTSWIMKYKQTNCTKMVYHKVWHCQHSKRNKTAAGRNTDCQARVDIKIKKVNKDTKKNDEFLRKAVPLPAVVKLRERHNHSTESADALRLLRASPETRSAFSEYFEEGMTPAEAIQHHEQLLSAKPDGPFLLANGSINPNRKSVYFWHQKWRNAKCGPAGNPVAKLPEKVDEYAAGGALCVHVRQCQSGKRCPA
ncbi:uncharacterized protein [Dermacentor albipictus]|uniref:uncharacterized protein isoform X2 n=1 Tax=Dermacentor albipictus TaxID=60249 RepID=UPI0031FD5EF1